MAHDTFSVGDLTAVIGDNAVHEGHRAGYNGLWSLRHKQSTRSVFVPGIAGLNLEHVFNGETEFGGRDVFFEPRRAAMTFRKVNAATAELHVNVSSVPLVVETGQLLNVVIISDRLEPLAAAIGRSQREGRHVDRDRPRPARAADPDVGCVGRECCATEAPARRE